MAKKKGESFFWTSFSDLMTSLFFIMLVLFVLTMGYLKVKQKVIEDTLQQLEEEKGKLQASNEQLQATNEQLQGILRLEDQFRVLEKDNGFLYLEECKKYVARDLIGKEIFLPNKTEILPQYIESTINVGRKIESFLDRLLQENKGFSYLLVIEGNMANTYDHQFNIDNSLGYKISYERALVVYTLWNENNINLRRNNIEVLISGSGFNGLCRDYVEENNKRFSIQIIPKVEVPNI